LRQEHVTKYKQQQKSTSYDNILVRSGFCIPGLNPGRDPVACEGDCLALT